MNRRVQVEIAVPIYEPREGYCVVPVGLQRLEIAPGAAAVLRGRVTLYGFLVGFVCHTAGLDIGEMTAGANPILHASRDPFPSEAAVDGIVIPSVRVQVSQDVTVEMTNRNAVAVAPRAYFLLEVPDAGAKGRHGARPGRSQ